MGSKKENLSLGDRMKNYEAEYESYVESSKHIVVRIDGHKFSKFTKNFKKPFDDILSKAMELTTMDLLKEFNAVTGYTQSDEITLIIPSYEDKTIDNRTSTKHKLHKCVKENYSHEYNGRIQKMTSLIAGYCTMSFNKHLGALTNTYYVTPEAEYDYVMMIITKKLGNAWFDARIYGVDSADEAFNSVLWRYRDCIKNSRSMHAQTYCSHKELHKLTGKEQSEYCLNKTGEDWNEIEDRYKYGLFIKKEKYTKSMYIEYHNRIEEVERSRIISFTMEDLRFSEENVKLIMNKVKE